MDIYNNIANIIFRFAYPVGFIGAIMFSINSIIAVDFFSIFFNKSIILILNMYVGICGYIAFCTFFNIDINIADIIIDFDNIYVAVGKDVTNNDAPLFIMSKDYNIKNGQTQISLTG